MKDANYRTEENPDSVAKVDNSHIYTYDANGNLVYVNTGRIKQDGALDSTAAERKLRWDEENRLTASDDNGFVTNYWYDADGERTVKTSGEGEQLYVNSEFAGGRTNTAKFSLYVSPYLVANQGGRYTKHIYIGSQRIVSKIGDFASYGSDPRRIQYAGSETDGLSVNYKQKYSAQQQVIKDNYAIFEVPYNGTDNNDYVDGQGFCCDDGSPEAAQARALALENNFQNPDAYEKLQFYYHPDHLGSSSYITNLDGEVVQHIEYVPFGEVFMEERNNIWNTPYLFNAKEFDEETGLYYYGARYYDPRLSLWMSTDQLQEKYPNNSTYCYTHNNPIVYQDPNGKDAILIVYPDYSINLYNTPEINIPFIGKIPKQKININIVGHAGILLIDNKTGITKYYEYGRYDTTDGTVGRVRNVKVSNVTIGKDGKPTIESLNKVLGELSKKAGQGGRIDGAYIISNEFDKMNNYANSKLMESNPSEGNTAYNKNRKPYSLTEHNCGTFAADVINQDESVDAPRIFDPTPVNIVDEYQEEGNAVVNYNPNNNKTTIGKGDESDAKKN